MFTIMNPDMDLFETFSNNLKEKIKASPEWESNSKRESNKGDSGFDDFADDSIPF